jgi:hypothetical protein
MIWTLLQHYLAAYSLIQHSLLLLLLLLLLAAVKAMPINDGWLRDWGPSCIARVDPETGKRQVAGVHWDYDW